MEFRFRPEDPCSHPAFGQVHSCNNLLLRISKSSDSNQSKDSGSVNSDVLCADIVARVPEAYTFNGELLITLFRLLMILV